MTRAASVFGLVPLLLAIAAPARALDRLVINYGTLPPVTIPVQELSSFASTGQPSQTLSSLMTLGNLQPERLRTMLNTTLPISGAQYSAVIQSGLVGDIVKDYQDVLGLQAGTPLTGPTLEATLKPISAQPQLSVIQAMGALPYDSLTIDAQKLIQASTTYGEQLRSLGIDLSQLGLKPAAPGSIAPSSGTSVASPSPAPTTAPAAAPSSSPASTTPGSSPAATTAPSGQPQP